MYGEHRSWTLTDCLRLEDEVSISRPQVRNLDHGLKDTTPSGATAGGGEVVHEPLVTKSGCVLLAIHIDSAVPSLAGR